MSSFETKLRQLADELITVEAELSDTEVMNNRTRMKEVSQRHAELMPIIKDYEEWKRQLAEQADLNSVLNGDDEELAEMAREELEEIKQAIEETEQRLQLALLPKNPFADRNIIMEIRGGTGGEEAALFAGDLFRMYTRYAERKRWAVEVLSSNETGRGGFKEIIFSITENAVYSDLQFEGGTHRVQRVPETESQGRVHTSAATVAVLAEADEVDIEIKPEDIRIDVFRSSGPGGQSVNTTDSAVRINHVPTGLVVSCQDEKSQHKNRAKALKVLRSRLLEMEQNKVAEEHNQQRQNMVGSGDRSGRIRTYNFPDNRVTDHRIHLTLHRLEAIMQGELDELINALQRENQQNLLEQTV